LIINPTTLKDDVSLLSFARYRMHKAWLEGPSVSLWSQVGVAILDFSYLAFWIISIIMITRQFTPRRAHLAACEYLLMVLREWIR
jgi:hypothetical protein